MFSNNSNLLKDMDPKELLRLYEEESERHMTLVQRNIDLNSISDEIKFHKAMFQFFESIITKLRFEMNLDEKPDINDEEAISEYYSKRGDELRERFEDCANGHDADRTYMAQYYNSMSVYYKMLASI